MRGYFAHLLTMPETGKKLSLGRIVLGIILILHFKRYLVPGYIEELYFRYAFTLRYPLFIWLEPLSPDMMHLLAMIGTVCSCLFCIGLLYRLSALILFLIFSYFFLLNAAYYNNHYYAIQLLLGLFLLTQGSLHYSLDQYLFRHPDRIAAWETNVFKLIIFIIYFYGGLSKLNGFWLSKANGEIFAEELYGVTEQGMRMYLGYFITWGGLLFDLSIFFLLNKKRLRFIGILISIIFNIHNYIYFEIGVFPIMMMGLNVLFLTEEDITRVERFALKHFSSSFSELQKLFLPKIQATFHPRQYILYFIILPFSFFQLLFPFRKYAYEGDHVWNREGNLFGWNMMSAITAYEGRFYYQTEGKKQEINVGEYMGKRTYRTLCHMPRYLPQFTSFFFQLKERDKIKVSSMTCKIYLQYNTCVPAMIISPDENLLFIKHDLIQQNEWIKENDLTNCKY